MPLVGAWIHGNRNLILGVPIRQRLRPRVPKIWFQYRIAVVSLSPLAVVVGMLVVGVNLSSPTTNRRCVADALVLSLLVLPALPQSSSLENGENTSSDVGGAAIDNGASIDPAVVPPTQPGLGLTYTVAVDIPNLSL